MKLTEYQQNFLELISTEEVKLFELGEEGMEAFDELHNRGLVDTDMHGTLYRVETKEEEEEPTQSMNKRFTQNDRIEARKIAANSKERLREYAREEPQVRSLLENAETSWMYAEQEKSVEDAVKLYRLVSSAQTLAEKLMDNVSKHRNQLIDL